MLLDMRLIEGWLKLCEALEAMRRPKRKIFDDMFVRSEASTS
jgi:hypothetical protein